MSAGFSNLVKDAAIIELLQRLRRDLGAGSFVVCDHWDADLCAVGVAKVGDERTLAYVSVYGNSPGAYYLELEDGAGDGADWQTVGRWERIAYSELRDRIAEHIGTKNQRTS
jgi:hypothetical protein